MAGRGPAPKPAAQRRRRNRAPEEAVLPAGGYEGDFPPLPREWRRAGADGPVRVRFLVQTRAWYQQWARSPMAVEWTSVHWQRLQAIAVLYDQFARTGSVELARELRLQEAGFGGTPLDLRRLGRRIEPTSPDPTPDLGEPPPVRRLRVVDPGLTRR